MVQCAVLRDHIVTAIQIIKFLCPGGVALGRLACSRPSQFPIFDLLVSDFSADVVARVSVLELSGVILASSLCTICFVS